MKRLISVALFLSLAVSSICVPQVLASGGSITSTELDACSQVAAVQTGEGTYTTADAASVQYRSSEEILGFIKGREGFSAVPYWDYAQWTVGYGTYCKNKDGSRCDNYNGGVIPPEMDERYLEVTKEEAEAFLREEIAESYEPFITAYEKKHDLSFTQSQFDALLSFTFNLGPAWTSGGYMLSDWLEGKSSDPSDLGLVRGMGVWCRVAGSVAWGTCERRLREAQIFLYGDYQGDGDHPNYRYVKYKGNGSLLSGRYTDAVDYFRKGEAYGSLLEPVWNAAKASATAATATATASALPFTDVRQEDWFYENVRTVYRLGLMQGISATTFKPSGLLTRGQMVTVLYRLEGSPSVSGASGFTDIPEGQYYSDAVTWAAKNGIVNGVTADTFRPNDGVTREQITAILYRYYGSYKGHDVSQVAPLSSYVDSDRISDYAEAPMAWAVAVGLVQGVHTAAEAPRLAPRGTTTRAQLAALLTRLIALTNGGVEGPAFLGWYDEDGNLVTNSTVVTDNLLLEARWSTD